MKKQPVIDIPFLEKLSREAGDAILPYYYEENLSVQFKEDESPLTAADKASHEIITKGLKQRYPDIPIISEEDTHLVTFEERKSWPMFWLIDPLDGTKEFIKKRKEFTTNIALIIDGKPVIGVVYAPVLDWMYVGDLLQSTAYKKEKLLESTLSSIRSEGQKVIAVRSKSHANPEEESVLNLFEVNDTVSMGSSLKFCLIAEGKADIYYRKNPTWEWDSAAAHAVVLAAGGKVYNECWREKNELQYNKRSLKNEFGFMCVNQRMIKQNQGWE